MCCCKIQHVGGGQNKGQARGLTSQGGGFLGALVRSKIFAYAKKDKAALEGSPTSITECSACVCACGTLGKLVTTRGRTHVSQWAGGLHAGPRVAFTGHTAASLGPPWTAATRRWRKIQNPDRQKIKTRPSFQKHRWRQSFFKTYHTIYSSRLILEMLLDFQHPTPYQL